MKEAKFYLISALITISLLILQAGVFYGSFSTRLATAETALTSNKIDHDAIIGMAEDVKSIKDDVRDIKSDMKLRKH